MLLWLQLLFCLAVIGYAGYFLSRYGDIIAEKTGMSASWVGLILLSTATSLPELVTGISAVTFANAPNIAVGDVLGSTVFNLFILVILDALYRRETLYSRAAQGHILSASLGTILITFAGFSLLLDHAGMSPALGHVGLYSPFIVLIYFVAMRAVFSYERRILSEYTEVSAERYPDVTLRSAVKGYALAASAIVIVGSWLPFVAKDISDLMGWGQTFVGTLLVAAVTSAPEAAVTISAMRIGALDMAIANLLGSNLFNIIILSVDDLFYSNGPLLVHVDASQALTALTAVMMSALVVVGLIFRSQRYAVMGLTWVSLGLFLMYILNTWILFQHGH
ncbi:Cation:H+ antiporter [Candidatus Nitrotoga sp. BS]|uniref:sodium:calcium antiporter n=1 Tax=Candidatus Nitrotoga sp. BS TaxID=2890408 RepID=UPI001EF1EDB3|nr:sodium:calcium antiporter [Candidatus Nitrotoga sp. BS]CAH1202058.1 Cation:H+ antiporter [Candidatus Nitrotoga sp. BS]